jgi:hypothetical protein
VEDITERLARLSPARRRLLELQRGGTIERSAAPASSPLPLTPEQETVWRRIERAPRAFYNWGLPVRLLGELDVPALERTMTTLVARHDALRARIVEDGGLSQQIAAPTPVSLPLIDLQHVPEAERDAAALVRVTELCSVRLDPRGDQLWQASLLRVRPREHVLVLLVDELVCDDRSRILLMKELVELYESDRAGRPARLPELEVSYGDYVRRRRRWLTGAEAARQTRGWADSLTGARTLELAAGPWVPERSHNGAPLSYEPEAPLIRAIGELVASEDVSLYNVMLAAFSTLLATAAGRTDVVITTHTFNRLEAASERLVGNFLTDLLMRCRWTGDPTFRELLGVARRVTLEAYDRKETPVWDVAADLGWDDYRLRSPLGQYLLAVHDDSNPLPTPEGDLDMQFEYVYLGQLFGDLGLFSYHNLGEGRLAVRLEYDVRLFDEAALVRFRDALDVLLTRVSARPDDRLSTLMAGLAWLDPGQVASH